MSQGDSISSLIHQVKSNTLVHALLISGEEGVGKWTLAKSTAAALLCSDQGDVKPCGHCRSCLQMESLANPNLTVLEKGAPISDTTTKTVIPVSDIREMIRRVSLNGFQGERRVVLIHRAEDLNQAAQDAFLKTLEEPPEDTYFILTCKAPENLLTTIVSRCRPLKLHPWGRDDVLRILSENGFTGSKAADAADAAGGSPGKALTVAGDEAYWTFRDEVYRDFLFTESHSDILRISTKWKDRKAEAESLLTMLEHFLDQLMRCALCGEDFPLQKNRDAERWVSFADKATKQDFIRLFDAVSLARNRVLSQVNFQAAVEQLLFAFMEAVNI